MEVINVLLLVVSIIFILYKIGTHTFGYWKKKGVKEMNPWPFVGDHYPLLFRKLDALEIFWRFYDFFKKYGSGGIYLFRVPFLIVTETEILKQIMVKDAEYFVNRYDWTNNSDPLFSRNLVILKDEKWKKMRAVMSTVFTSSKMKDMFRFMVQCAEQSAQYLEEQLKEKQQHSGKQIHEVDVKDFFSRYGTDVIGSTAFGLEIDSFKNPNNEFYCAGKYVRDTFQGNNFAKLMFLFLFPELAKKFNITFFNKEVTEFFINVVSETIRERELKNIVRKDVIHILMEARKEKEISENGEMAKGKLPGLTDLDITAQAIVFFFAGFETIASLLAFTCYELAVNPNIQQQLQEEIDDIYERENGFTYENVMHQMQYLNMVINEALRKWPPATMTDRVASKAYVIPKTDKHQEIVLSKGDRVFIPIAGLHYDSEYFPNPQKFDPERFRDEKNTIKPFTYLPFGDGPRHCVGMRYALMEAKTILVHLLRKFTVVPTAKTSIPLKLTKKAAFMLVPEKDFALGLQMRNK